MKGIYVFTPAAIAAEAARKVSTGPFPDVVGFDWLIGWDKVITAPGAYNWAVLDDARAAADGIGKRSQLCMLPGFAEPAYVLTKCPVIQIKQLNTGKFVTMANPVTPAFLTELHSWIHALGSHIASDTDIDSVQTTGLGDQGEMTMGQLVSGTWADHGITPVTLRNAWESVITMWGGALPKVARTLAIDEPLGHASKILPGLLAWLHAAEPTHMAQQNGLKASTGEQVGSLWAELESLHVLGHTVGWQMFGFGPANGDLRTALEIGLAAGASYFQIYLQDVINPANTATLAWLNKQVGLA